MAVSSGTLQAPILKAKEMDEVFFMNLLHYVCVCVCVKREKRMMGNEEDDMQSRLRVRCESWHR